MNKWVLPRQLVGKLESPQNIAPENKKKGLMPFKGDSKNKVVETFHQAFAEIKRWMWRPEPAWQLGGKRRGLDACSIWKQKLRNHKKKHVEGHYLNAKTFIYLLFILVENVFKWMKAQWFLIVLLGDK